MRILVIGCASQDTIHLEQSSQTVHCLGGAGLYTAVAASAAGAQCTLLAPRIESPKLSSDLEQEFCFDWIGPQVSEADFPRLEIRHHGNDRATLCGASWGAETLLTPDMLPADLSEYSIVHIAALSSAGRQREFLQAIRARSLCKISIGTYARLAYGETDLLREMIRTSDFVFMNENEAKAAFNSEVFPLKPEEGQIICVTHGRDGAVIYSGEKVLRLNGIQVKEFDPTGAGDTFAGTMLACLAQQRTVAESADLAIQRSALVITQAGPAAICQL